MFRNKNLYSKNRRIYEKCFKKIYKRLCIFQLWPGISKGWKDDFIWLVPISWWFLFTTHIKPITNKNLLCARLFHKSLFRKLGTTKHGRAYKNYAHNYTVKVFNSTIHWLNLILLILILTLETCWNICWLKRKALISNDFKNSFS